MYERDPNNLIRRAVRGMLPKNRTRRHLMDRLKTYGSEVHPHEAQTDRLVFWRICFVLFCFVLFCFVLFCLFCLSLFP